MDCLKLATLNSYQWNWIIDHPTCDVQIRNQIFNWFYSERHYHRFRGKWAKSIILGANKIYHKSWGDKLILLWSYNLNACFRKYFRHGKIHGRLRIRRSNFLRIHGYEEWNPSNSVVRDWDWDWLSSGWTSASLKAVIVGVIRHLSC